MNILSVDTSREPLSIALKTDSSYEERLVSGAFSPSEDLLSEITALLSRVKLNIKDIDLLVATKGPGSFTGLRVALASLKGIRAASGAKLVTIPTLEAMAYTIKDISQFPILPVIDAKKKRFYYALYSNEAKEILEVKDSAAENVSEDVKAFDKVVITGEDAPSFISKIEDEDVKKKFIIDRNCPRNLSKALIELALLRLETAGEDEIGLGPLYVRRSDAEEALLKKKEEKNE